MAQLVRAPAQGMCQAKHHGFHLHTTIEYLEPVAYLVQDGFVFLFCLFVFCTGQQHIERQAK